MRRWDVYRGRRFGGGRLPSILLAAASVLFLLFLVLFFTLPGYLVYSKDGVKLDLPMLRTEETAAAEEETEQNAETVVEAAAELRYQNPDYSSLNMAATANLGIVQSIYVPYEYMNESGLTKAVARARELDVKGLTMEVADESGQLLWVSETKTARDYALGGTLDLKKNVEELKSQGYRLTAVVSCCVNNLLVSRNPTWALQVGNGIVYSDQRGAWLDPWNSRVRQYIIDLTAELMDMGFDEVVLNHAEHPNAQVLYTRTMSEEMSREACVTNFSIAVRRGVQETIDRTGANLSAMLDTDALNNAAIDNGQNLSYMLQVYDRVYEYTETYQEANLVIALHVDSTERFVPVISWTFPGGSWAENYFESGKR
ncbi:MAG: putative glycoside hydrolase [Oscillospiraceae bacterium]|nr:putative glycoside hydrolase [Oscillospiraceae bacterium]